MELSGDGPLPVMHFGMNGMLMVRPVVARLEELGSSFHGDS
jgi:hypothetical protein